MQVAHRSFTAGREWLGGMGVGGEGAGAEEAGVTIQYCMSLPR